MSEVSTVSVDCPPELAAVRVHPLKERSNNAFDVSVMLSPEIAWGNHDFIVRINGKDRSGQDLPSGGIRVAAIVRYPVQTIPQDVRFGRIREGDSSHLRQEFVLADAEGRGFQLLKVDESLAASVSLDVISTTESRVLCELHLDRPSVGYHKEGLRLLVQAEEEAPSWIEVPVYYRYDPTRDGV